MNDSDSKQIMDALGVMANEISGLKEQVRIQNGRVHAGEVARADIAIALASYQKQTDDRLALIEPITRDVSEIVSFTRTTGKIAKWLSAITGALVGLAGLAAIVERGIT